MALRALIVDGHLVEREKLPPGRLLAQQLGLSRGAVVAAYEQLIAEGFAVARVGSGTFVSQTLPSAPSRKPAILPSAPPARLRPGRLGLGMADEKSLEQLRKLINRSLARASLHQPGSPDPRGSEALRIEIATYLRVARAARVEPDRIVLTTGAQQAIDLVLRAALNAGDKVWVEDPCYSGAIQAVHGNGLAAVPVRVTDEGLDVAAGIRRAPDARAVYVTPSHQFPLGVMLTLPRRVALLEWAARAGAYVIEDDYDSEFRYGGAPLASLQGMDAAERVIYIGSFSKALMQGLRCGYLVAPRPLLTRLMEARQRIDRSPSSLIDDALAAFLRDGHFARHLKRARARALSARDALVEGLTAKGIEVQSPDQGLHLVAETATRSDEAALIARLDRAGLAAHALSGLFQNAARARMGAVIGFSGFDASAFAKTLRKL